MKRSHTRDRRFPGAGRTTRIRRRHVPRLRPQVKFFDTIGNASQSSTQWVNSIVPYSRYISSDGGDTVSADTCLVPTSIGEGYGQVAGHQYAIKKLHVRGNLALLNLNAQTVIDINTPPPTVTLLLVLDRQPNGAQATGSSIIGSNSAASEHQFKRMQFGLAHRFSILKRKRVQFTRCIAGPTFVDPEFDIDPDLGGTRPAFTQTFSYDYDTHDFDFEYTPRAPLKCQILPDNPYSVAATVDCNIFLLMHTDTGTVCINRFASRCYFCDL